MILRDKLLLALYSKVTECRWVAPKLSKQNKTSTILQGEPGHLTKLGDLTPGPDSRLRGMSQVKVARGWSKGVDTWGLLQDSPSSVTGTVPWRKCRLAAANSQGAPLPSHKAVSNLPLPIFHHFLLKRGSAL